MDDNDAMEIDYKCYDLRNDIKSEMTKQIYLEPRLYPIHNKIRVWYNFIINNIYTNPNIKQEIFKFITNNITNDVQLNTFLDSVSSSSYKLMLNQMILCLQKICMKHFHLLGKQSNHHL